MSCFAVDAITLANDFMLASGGTRQARQFSAQGYTEVIHTAFLCCYRAGLHVSMK